MTYTCDTSSPPSTCLPVEIPLYRLIASGASYPRSRVSEERIAIFQSLYAAGEGLPPIEVVPFDDSTYLIADGVHRHYAAQDSGRASLPAIVLTVGSGETPIDCAYRRAIETATRASQPLSYAERRTAAARLLSTRSDLSHRAIARILGLSHNTINRWASELDESSTGVLRDEKQKPPPPTSADMARRLVGSLARFEMAADLQEDVGPAHMGGHLAQAFVDRFDEAAFEEAHKFATWLVEAITALEAGGF